MSSPINVVHVLTDVGVKDIDDELPLKYLAQNRFPLNLLIVFTGSDGISAGDALSIGFEPMKRQLVRI